MSEMTDEEYRETNKLYNPANIDRMIQKCRSNDFTSLTFYEIAEKELIEDALKFYKKKPKLKGIIDRLKERREKLSQMISDTEPEYWYKERYALDTLDYIIGKEKCKKCTKDKEGEER